MCMRAETANQSFRQNAQAQVADILQAFSV